MLWTPTPSLIIAPAPRHRPDLPVVSLDDVREDLQVDANDDQGVVIQAARERCQELLRSGRSFAFNATNLLRQTRRRWIDLFADYEDRIEIVYIEPPLPVILERNRRRDRPVPEKIIGGSRPGASRRHGPRPTA